jgi:hydrogenase maturation protein HypF
MIARGFNSPQTSSLGRLFDAVAALVGLRGAVLYEGQAAIELEALAKTYTGPTTVYPFILHPGHPATLDVTPLLSALVKDMKEGVPVASIARCFHRSVATMLARSCDYARQQTNLNKVALSGGVFQNEPLLEDLSASLQTMGFQVYTNRCVPPNDGGISLGQLAIAAARLRQAKK